MAALLHMPREVADSQIAEWGILNKYHRRRILRKLSAAFRPAPCGEQQEGADKDKEIEMTDVQTVALSVQTVALSVQTVALSVATLATPALPNTLTTSTVAPAHQTASVAGDVTQEEGAVQMDETDRTEGISSLYSACAARPPATLACGRAALTSITHGCMGSSSHMLEGEGAREKEEEESNVDQMDCNTLQHNATHCNTLQHTATHCNTRQHTATHCNTLQHTAAHTASQPRLSVSSHAGSADASGVCAVVCAEAGKCCLCEEDQVATHHCDTCGPLCSDCTRSHIRFPHHSLLLASSLARSLACAFSRSRSLSRALFSTELVSAALSLAFSLQVNPPPLPPFLFFSLAL